MDDGVGLTSFQELLGQLRRYLDRNSSLRQTLIPNELFSFVYATELCTHIRLLSDKRRFVPLL